MRPKVFQSHMPASVAFTCFCFGPPRFLEDFAFALRLADALPLGEGFCTAPSGSAFTFTARIDLGSQAEFERTRIPFHHECEIQSCGLDLTTKLLRATSNFVQALKRSFNSTPKSLQRLGSRFEDMHSISSKFACLPNLAESRRASPWIEVSLA